MSVWDGLVGAEGPVELLGRDLVSGRVAHAYLFAGASGRTGIDAALAFAAALVCPQGGCGVCDGCGRVLHQAHPDVEVVEPAGMQLLVEQVRDAVRAAWRTPVAAPRRVIVVDQADRMNPSAQNAFLKALEEPPERTVIVLVAPTPEALLETVRSRCREISFHTPPPREVAESLVRDGFPPEEARRWARLGGGLERSRSLARDEQARQARAGLVERLLDLGSHPGDALELAEWLAATTKQVRERVAEAHKAAAAEYADWYKEARKAADDRLRREQRRAETDALESALDDVATVLRDLLAVLADPSASLLDEETRPRLAAVAGRLDRRAEGGLLTALAGVERARRRLRANANVAVTLEQVLLDVRRALHGPVGAGTV